MFNKNQKRTENRITQCSFKSPAAYLVIRSPPHQKRLFYWVSKKKMWNLEQSGATSSQWFPVFSSLSVLQAAFLSLSALIFISPSPPCLFECHMPHSVSSLFHAASSSVSHYSPISPGLLSHFRAQGIFPQRAAWVFFFFFSLVDKPGKDEVLRKCCSWSRFGTFSRAQPRRAFLKTGGWEKVALKKRPNDRSCMWILDGRAAFNGVKTLEDWH